MFKKCVQKVFKNFLIPNGRNYSRVSRNQFATSNFFQNVIKRTKCISIRTCGTRNTLCTTSNISTKVFLMLTYYYNAKTKEEANNILAELLDIIQTELNQRNYESAENMLKMSMQIAEEHKLYNIWSDLAYTLALIALSLNKLEKAENILVNTIEQLHLWGYQEDDHQIVDLNFCLSNVLSWEGKDQMADLGFKSCLEHQVRKISGDEKKNEDIQLYVDILYYYGLHMMRRKQLKEAKEQIDAACSLVSILEQVPLTKKMVIFYKRAELNARLGDYNGALNDMIEVTALAKETGSRDLPHCYMKLAEICVMLKLYNEAKDAYEEALRYATMFYKFESIGEIQGNITELEKYLS